MRIGMVLGKPYPPDIRVDKEVRMLLEGGHQVYLFCKRGETKEERGQAKIGIRHFQPPDNVLLRKFDSLCFHLAFRKPLWQRENERFVGDFSIDVLHIHDLPLAGPVYAVAQKRGIPVVADLHENYPAALQEWYAPYLRKKVLYNYQRWKNYEASILAKVSHIIVVVEESKEYLLEYGLPPEKITVIANAAHPDFASKPIDEALVAHYSSYFVISYIGGFGPHRGIEVAIRAMQSIKPMMPSSRLLLVGQRNNRSGRELKRLVEELGMGDCVEFVGWQPFDKIPSYIRASQICLVPHNLGTQTNASAPHKLFQYWVMGKPVIVSSCRSLQRIVEEAQGGLVFGAEEPEDLARCILKLYRDSDLARTLGENGRAAAFSGSYSWRKTMIRLNRVYDQLC